MNWYLFTPPHQNSCTLASIHTGFLNPFYTHTTPHHFMTQPTMTQHALTIPTTIAIDHNGITGTRRGDDLDVIQNNDVEEASIALTQLQHNYH